MKPSTSHLSPSAAVLLMIPCCLMLCQPLARAEDFCALTVEVLGDDLRPGSSTWVELLDERGNSELVKSVLGSTLRICDFSFGPHTLRVGTNECLPVSVSNLQVRFGTPIHLKVILNACGYREQVRNACLLYIRAVDDANKPLGGAEVAPVGPYADAPTKTDSYGRIQQLYRGDREFVLTKEGYEPGRARVKCDKTEELDVKIVMKKTE